jgi:hypothetical protein
MARRKTPQELERQELAKAARSMIRLKYAIAADEEINEVLFDILDRFDEAMAAGLPFEFKLSELTDHVQRLP